MTDKMFDMRVKLKAKKKASDIVDKTFISAYFPDDSREKFTNLLRELTETSCIETATEMRDEMKNYLTE